MKTEVTLYLPDGGIIFWYTDKKPAECITACGVVFPTGPGEGLRTTFLSAGSNFTMRTKIQEPKD